MKWSETYREAAKRCFALQAAETNDLVRSALGDAAAKFTVSMLEHQVIELRAIKQGALGC